jgi:capsular exopolysaccharide synthesis family protein
MSRLDQAMSRASRRGALGSRTASETWRASDEFAFEPASSSSIAGLASFGPAPPTRPADFDALWPDRQAVRKNEKIVVGPMARACVEQYRKIGAALHELQSARASKTLLITSALAREGKTLTACNLALTLSHSYNQKVLLIDADLRRPGVHKLLRVPNVNGLSHALASHRSTATYVCQLSDTLFVLPAGEPDPDPFAGLTSVRMRRLVHECADGVNWVLIDTPPVGLLADATSLAVMADLTLLVVRAGATPYQLVQRAIDAIGRERLAGVVMNGVERSQLADAYEYYGYQEGEPTS